MTAHLFNDYVFAVIVQPDRHFRRETKFSDKDTMKQEANKELEKHEFLIFPAYTQVYRG